jgi:outer membrane protein TolC
MLKRNTFPLAIASLSFLMFAGCAVGPKYHAPTPPKPAATNYKESTVNFQDAQGWKVASPQDAVLRGKWWEIFNEPDLNALEEQLNIDNQNIKQSFESFMEARALIAEARAQYWPTVTVAPSVTRSQTSSNLTNSTFANTGRIFTLLDFPVDISWAPDLFGKIRNQVREFQYAAQVSAADLENERLVEQASLAQF